MLIVKGVNIYPDAIRDAVSRFYPKTTGVMKIILDQPGPLVKPPLRVIAEYSQSVREAEREPLREEMKKFFRENLRVTPEIELVPPDSIQVEKGKTGKVKLIEVLKK